MPDRTGKGGSPKKFMPFVKNGPGKFSHSVNNIDCVPELNNITVENNRYFECFIQVIANCFMLKST